MTDVHHSIQHLSQALIDNACINCSCVLLAERNSRLARSDSSIAEAGLLPSGMPAFSPSMCCRHTQGQASNTKKKWKCDEPLALKVDTLASEFALD